MNSDDIVKNLSKLGMLEIYYAFNGEQSQFVCRIIRVCARTSDLSCIAHYPYGWGITVEMALKRLWDEMLVYPIFETEDRHNPKQRFTLIGGNLYERINPTVVSHWQPLPKPPELKT